jgi:hypothetical protein
MLLQTGVDGNSVRYLPNAMRHTTLRLAMPLPITLRQIEGELTAVSNRPCAGVSLVALLQTSQSLREMSRRSLAFRLV